ncbi:ribosome small subunit-dependent GTPase A [Bacillus sp. 31A1R]|uniref:Small ribosomal subunit biogenesis GTPase RsgA n=1 Tax=Robertmurraya mangrovi TaxID=3098077 RepID=A0ABU5J166_9BACI|nr:ribosome small subunit-dependent GTPase A [Bacillus sp. 31A1R]MDZ5473092.1 ribosome small subunit-dependent GTPase A [Bacillus sp. 31A1R]
MNLETVGWNLFFEEHFYHYKNKGLLPGRVLGKNKEIYTITDGDKTFYGKLSGKFRYKINLSKDFPAVGDWVVFQTKENSPFVYIQAVLPRKSYFSRKQPISGGRKIKNGVIVGGSTEEQIIASNIDKVLIIGGLDGDFDIRRIERYVTLAYNSGAVPIIILNKVDLCEEVDLYIEQVRSVALGIPILTVSAEKNINMSSLLGHIHSADTIALLGSSGVGKSTITNFLLGEEIQRKQTISKATGKGKHTTTSAELLIHPLGYMIIDTPGLREVQLWGEEDILEESFKDVIAFLGKCKYSNCNHQTESGCAIKEAIKDGMISEKRFESYQNQFDELYKLNKKRTQLDIQMSKKQKQRKLFRF